MLNTTLRNILLALRNLRRDWRFALAFVLPLALALGAGATFYSVLDQALYRSPPGIRDPDGIVRLAVVTDYAPNPFRANNISVGWLDLEALRQHSTTLSGVAGFVPFRPSLGRGADARTVSAMLVTASYFDVLGVRPQRGRFFSTDEDAVTATSVPCVVGDAFWRVQLGSAEDVLTRRLQVGRVDCQVIGVLPPRFNGAGLAPVDLWLPLRAAGEASHGNAALWNTDRSYWIRLLARARPGATIADINRDATRAYRTVTARPARDPQVKRTMVSEALMASTGMAASPRIRTARWLTGGAVVLFALVAANLLNLLIARNLGRLRETAIRRALGGSRSRLFGEQLLEAGALAIFAGIGALVVVRTAGPFVQSVLFPGVWADGPMTGRIVLLAMSASFLLSALIATLTTVYTSRVDVNSLLGGAGGSRTTASRAQHRLRLGLVGVQAALSMALLIVSSGFVRSFRAAVSADVGFDVTPVVYADIPNIESSFPTSDARREFYLSLQKRLQSVPGVVSVSLGFTTPWYNNHNERVREPGRDSLPPVPGFGQPGTDVVTSDWLATMGKTVRAGRWFTESDRPGAPPVMVVSASLAKLYWGDDRSALGRCLVVGATPECREVVGVIDDVRFMGGLDAAHTPSYWLPFPQATALALPPKMFIRTSGDAAEMVLALRRVVQGADPGLPAASVFALQTLLDPLLASWRLGAMSFTALGTLAALIAMLGLFSVLAFLVAERRREFAIRSALGARPAQIVVPVLSQTLVVVGAGVLVGLIASWRAAPWLQPQMFQILLLDPQVIVPVGAALLAVALIAAAGPARSAAAVHPATVLRAE